MTKYLEKLLDLPTTAVEPEPEVETAREFINTNKQIIDEVDTAIGKIDQALPLVRDLEAGDAELDELADLAKTKAEDLIDLGMNVDPRFAGVIFQTASTLLGHSISAKTAKMDKKLRMIQLQLQKAKLDHQIVKDSNNDSGLPSAVEGKGIVLDRNELLQQILGKKTE